MPDYLRSAKYHVGAWAAVALLTATEIDRFFDLRGPVQIGGHPYITPCPDLYDVRLLGPDAPHVGRTTYKLAIDPTIR